MLARRRRQAGRDDDTARARNLDPHRHSAKGAGDNQRQDARVQEGFEIIDEKDLGGRPPLQPGLRRPLRRQFAGKAFPKDLTIPATERGEVLGSNAKLDQETVGQVVRQKIESAAEQLEVAERPRVDPGDKVGVSGNLASPHGRQKSPCRISVIRLRKRRGAGGTRDGRGPTGASRGWTPAHGNGALEAEPGISVLTFFRKAACDVHMKSCNILHYSRQARNTPPGGHHACDLRPPPLFLFRGDHRRQGLKVGVRQGRDQALH